MHSAAAGLELCQVVVVICARSKQRDWNYILRNRIKALSCLSVCCEMLLNTFVLTTSWRLTVWFVWGTVIQPRRRRGYGRHCKARNRYFIGNQLSTSIRTHADSDLRWVRANEIEKVMEEPRHHLNVLTLARTPTTCPQLTERRRWRIRVEQIVLILEYIDCWDWQWIECFIIGPNQRF